MIAFNEGQCTVIREAMNWYYNSSEQIFQFAGNPGTGKSLVLGEIIHRLGLEMNEVAPMAYTGAAAIVMRMKGLINASTIHSWLYEPVKVPATDENGYPILDSYFNKPIMTIKFIPKELFGIKLIVIDEASMVPMSMKKEILRRGIKIIATGDLDQLPPIADTPAFLVDGNVMILNEIMRQEEGSAIIYLSQRAKLGLPISLGMYNNVWVTTEDQLTPELLLSSDILLCARNNTRDRFNKYIREDLLGIHSTLPIFGDKLICRKNNHNIQTAGIELANGLLGRVANQPDVAGFDGKTFKIDFVPDLLDAKFEQLQCDYTYFTASYEQRKALKNLKYDTGEKFELGYASTVHLAQGSQFRNGIYIEEYMGDISNALNYTALTRFSNMCIYVKQKPKYTKMYR